MNDFKSSFVTVAIPACVTIIGFISTYVLNKRNFKEELNKQKININLDKISDLPFKIFSVLDLILDNKDKNITKSKVALGKYKELMASIFAYGSAQAISITTNLQELTYLSPEAKKSTDNSEVIVYYILLLCQVKYDLTGTEVNPEFWFRMKLNDYSKIEIRRSLNSVNNNIVDKLKLEKFLKIVELI